MATLLWSAGAKRLAVFMVLVALFSMGHALAGPQTHHPLIVIDQTDVKNVKPLQPLPNVKGWVQGKPKPLAPGSEGVIVPYHHPSGVTVSYYQYNRGLKKIKDDEKDKLLTDELDRVRLGIKQVVKFGYYKGSKEIKSGTVTLGKSKKKALWAKFEIVTDKKKATSQAFVWTNNNIFLKVRSTGQVVDSKKEEEALQQFLQAVGSMYQEEK